MSLLGAVMCLRWQNSGAFLASGSDDNVVMIWSLEQSVNSPISALESPGTRDHTDTLDIAGDEEAKSGAQQRVTSRTGRRSGV